MIRGETDHYDYVCGEAARGIMDVQLQTGVPCSFGVLTVDTLEQALERSGGDKRDSGRHAAEAVLALVDVERTSRRLTCRAGTAATRVRRIGEDRPMSTANDDLISASTPRSPRTTATRWPPATRPTRRSATRSSRT